MPKNRWFKLFCSILSTAVVLTCMPLRKRADSSPNIPTYSVTENLQFEVNVAIVSSWDNYANLEFVVSNTGNEIIHNWYLTTDLPYNIEGTWGTVASDCNNEGVYTFKNVGWNQDILPGNTISFGMTVSSIDGQPVSILPTFYLLNTTERVVDPSGYSLTYQEYSNWGAGYNGAIILENVSNEVIEDWKLSFATNRNLREVAGAVLETSDNVIYFSNDGDNQNLNSGTSWNMTITGGEQNCSDPMTISDIELTTICCAFGLNDDANLNGIPDYVEFINGQNQDPNITPTPTATPSPTPEVDPTETPTATPTPDVTVVPTPEPSPTPDPDLDSDGDGISDVYEEQLGTDPNSKDSDNDGIEDGVEVVMGLDPLSEDTDGDGTLDSQEDDDGDGLTLEEELDHGTYPWSEDSDVDGLSDGDEVNSYGSDPMNPDSDGDEIEDGDEIKLGTDPMLPDSDGDGIPDGQERFLQTREEEINNEERPAVTKVEVSLEGTGCLDSAMTIEDVYGRDTYSSDLVGLVGVPVNIEYEGDFDEATITFHYDEALLSANDSNLKEDFLVPAGHVSTPRSLGILYFDEETGLYLDCGATVDETNKTISCETTHFSTYMVVDKVVWEFYWKSLKYTGELRPSHEGYQGIDYVLEIPCVDTMTEEDIEEMNAISYQIIDHMQDGDRMVVCGYQNYGLGVYPYNMTDDKNVLKRRIDEWPWDNSGHWVGWNGAANETIKTSLGALSIFNVASTERLFWPKEENELVVIAFHNSTDIECTYYSASYRSGTEMTAYIFTLSNGNSKTIQDRWLNHMSGGGVIDCEGKSAADVYAEFADLYELRQGTDSESTNGMKTGDGLWDIYETQGMLGANGRFYVSGPGVLDYDEDNVDDVHEMGKRYIVTVDSESQVSLNGFSIDDCSHVSLKESMWVSLFADFGQGTWTIYGITSDPVDKDTDDDDATDDVDATPRRKNHKISYILYDAKKDADWFLRYEAYSRESINKKDQRIELIPIKDKQDFIEQWNSMGMDVDCPDKIRYSLNEVTLIFHGVWDEDKNQYDIGQISYDDIVNTIISPKTIAKLVLSSCHSGDVTDQSSVARAFMSWDTIDEVYAWNGTATYLGSADIHLLISIPLIDIPELDSGISLIIPMDVQVTLEMTEDFYDSLSVFGARSTVGIVSRIVSGDIFWWITGGVDILSDFKEMMDLGRVKYYKNEEGQVTWKKVSNSSLSIMFNVFSS